MLFRNAKRSERDVKPALVVLPAPMRVDSAPAADTSDEAQSQAELRRQMYERIAQGGAMAEAEDYASRMWTNY